MTVQDVDRLLYRKLKPGKEFENLIPKYEKVEHKFDKPTDNSDTYDTLKFMEQWSKKYSWQMSKIAPLLKGRTLEETCKNIYNFLYWHFQYKLDGEAQNLYSPSAAWHFRKKGFDCKSYSLLASTILSNLKIDCAFRMVQQSQPIWSHVYVIVPDGNKYHVIDATTHDNKEVRFTKKHDKYMYHQGLASPISANRLGCSCNGQSIAKTGLGNPNTLSKSIKNFHAFLDELERYGVSRQVTNNMLQIVKSNVQNGVDPNMSEVFKKAMAMSQQGLGRLGAGPSIMGIDASTAGAAYAGDPAAITSIVKNLIPGNFISSTFGAVFANGLNFSCWGASLTPQMASARLKKTYAPYFTKSLSNIENAPTFEAKKQAINDFVRMAHLICRYHIEIKPTEANWSSCARTAINKVYTPFFKSILDKANALVQQLQQDGATVTMTSIMPLTYFLPKSMTGDTVDITSKKTTKGLTNIPVLDFTNYNGGFTPTNNNPANTPPNYNFSENSNGTITATNPTTGQEAIITKEQALKLGYKPKSKSTSLVLPVLGIGAAAAFMFITPKTDVTKRAPKSAAKNRTKKK